MTEPAFWEEWVVWKCSSCPVDYAGFVCSVIRANLIVLLCVMAFAAAVALPQRLKSADFMKTAGAVRDLEVQPARLH